MADMMIFPDKFEDFIHQYEFKDTEEIYTNGAELIPSFRVMQAWGHYTRNIEQSLANIWDCAQMIQRNAEDIEEVCEYYED